MGSQSFISKLLDLGRRFSGTTEQFQAMVQYMQKEQPGLWQGRTAATGGMQKVMEINLKVRCVYKSDGQIVFAINIPIKADYFWPGWLNISNCTVKY